MSPERQCQAGRAVSFPRVSGDEPPSGEWEDAGEPFSPRERG